MIATSARMFISLLLLSAISSIDCQIVFRGVQIPSSSQSVARDTTGAEYVISHKLNSSQLPVNCSVSKIQQGQTVWTVVYDSSRNYCQGWAIAVSQGDIYAIFKTRSYDATSPMAINNNLVTLGGDAFSYGLWGLPGQGSPELDTLVMIDPVDGTLVYGTYLLSKYSSAPVPFFPSYPLVIKEITFTPNYLRITAHSTAVPPSPQADRNQYVAQGKSFDIDAFFDITRELQQITAVYPKAPANTAPYSAPYSPYP